jgi:hypothetical protein
MRPSLYTVPDDPARTMSAGRRHRRDRTFETVERVTLPAYDDIKAFFIWVTTGFAGRHQKLSSLGTKPKP